MTTHTEKQKCEYCENNGSFLNKELNGWPIMAAYTPDSKLEIWGPWGVIQDDAKFCHKCGRKLIEIQEGE